MRSRQSRPHEWTTRIIIFYLLDSYNYTIRSRPARPHEWTIIIFYLLDSYNYTIRSRPARSHQWTIIIFYLLDSYNYHTIRTSPAPRVNYNTFLSILSDIVPDQLKSARIKLLFKKNKWVFFGNYRLVATYIRCFISNILEKMVVHKHLIKPTCCNFNLALETLISPIFALLTFLTTFHLCNSMVGIDLQKRKEKERNTRIYQIRCNKLHAMRIGGSNRILPSKFIKTVQNVISKSCGISKGSILGPLSFL